MNFVAFVLGLLFSLQCFAADQLLFGPVQKNANPFVRIQGLPGYAGVDFVGQGDKAIMANIEINNEFYSQATGSEQINLDYERTQLNFNFLFGVSENLQAGLLLPLINNDGGFLDAVIENWHDWFSLPQGGRDEAPRDQLNISYSSQQAEFRLDESGSGIGDVSLFVERKLVAQTHQDLNLKAQLKLPTGDEQRLFGSGGFGLSLSLSGRHVFNPKWQLYGLLGVTYIGDGDVLERQLNDFAANAVMGIYWQPLPKWGVATQLDFNTDIYEDTDLDALGGAAGVLNISGNYKFAKKARMYFGFSEDVIRSEASPDFAVNLGFHYLY